MQQSDSNFEPIRRPRFGRQERTTSHQPRNTKRDKRAAAAKALAQYEASTVDALWLADEVTSR